MLWHPNTDGGVTPRAAWLRLYLGYAPGVGKTYAMLQEGERRRRRGSDVVVGWVEAYNRPRTLDAIGDLEIIPPRTITHRGVAVQEMDLEGILARRPQVALVDELAHTNVAGSKNTRRYQDALELQASGVSVISTLNIQQLASLQDTVRLVTGVNVTDVLPDWVLDSADEVEMVDASPDALRKRVQRGNVLPKEQVERALDGYFRTDTLMALRELTLRRTSDHARFRLHLGRQSTETVLVCLPASSQAQTVLRRGSELAERLQARLVVLHVTQPMRTFSAESSRGHQEAVKALQLAGALGSEVHTRQANNVAEAIVSFAAEMGVTQLVLGESSHSRWRELLWGSVMRDVLQRSRNVDVHIVRRAAL